MTAPSRSRAIRAQLGHPVVDADGHMIELETGFLDYLREEAGPSMLAERTPWSGNVLLRWYKMSVDERRQTRALRPPWWAVPTRNTLDLATAMLPGLLYERLDDLGVDFAVLYPTLGLFWARNTANPDDQRIVCRALNRFYADRFRAYADRLTPVAVIPMSSPEQAIEELEYAVGVLELKAVMLNAVIVRPRTARGPMWVDAHGIDSAYDYDPVWRTCVELGVAPTSHTAAFWGARTSISSYLHNHLGLFAEAGDALCKSLFLAGVTRRFPTLNFGFLEGGVAWACSLFSGLVEHWERRNRDALSHYDPAQLDRALLDRLLERHGERALGDGPIETVLPELAWTAGWAAQDPNDLDEFAACRIERVEDLRDLFVPNFYFGCEGDDRTTAWAFDQRVNPFGSRLNAMLGSDLGHWDLPEMTDLLVGPYELLEQKLLSERDLFDFVFGNVVRFYTRSSPAFFKGTIVENQVERLVAASTT